MEDNEEWSVVNDYENYEVSSLGKVRNKTTGRLLKQSNHGGYMIVGLCKNGKCKCIPVHRLICIAFIPNPENKPQVNHKDKNRNNNCVTNLEWNTALENKLHRSNNCIQTTNQNIKVWRVDLQTNEKLQLYDSINMAAKWIYENNYSNNFDIIRVGISYSIKKIFNSSHGFKWEKHEQTDLENEIWKNVIILGKEVSNYYVSNLGRFKNSKGIIMENYKPHHSGYIYIRINKDKYALHRLIASTFIDNSENKPAVNHIDGNKTNNHANNLEWVTIQENNQHNHNIGLIKLYTRAIIQYDLELNEIKRFDSIKHAMDELKIKSIKEVLYNKQKTAGGFIFKYTN